MYTDKTSVDTQIFIKEKINITLNNSILLSGESLLYKIYNHTNSNSKSLLSKISYVSLRNERDSIIFNHKLVLNQKGTQQGAFFIPSTLKTGVYRLLGYTNFSRNNFKKPFSSKTIYIINPFIKTTNFPKKINSSESITVRSIVTTDTTGVKKSQNDILIKTDKETYKTREKITLSIDNFIKKAGHGDYVLSVRKTDSVLVLDSSVQNTNHTQNESIFYLPELRGELISGKIIPVEEKTPIKNKIITLTILGENYIFKVSKTNNNGHFFFSIPEIHQTSNSIVQINEPDRDKYKLILDKKELSLKKKTANTNLQLDPSIKNWLQERSIQLQIKNAYFNPSTKTTLKEHYIPSFYNTMGTKYVLDDYNRFNTMKETFVEIVKLAGVRKKRKKNKFVIFPTRDLEGKTLFSSLDPLVLMDGILIQEADEILDYDAKNIKSINVLEKPYRYGPKVYGGIIDIKTIKQNFRPKMQGDYIKELKIEKSLVYNELYSPDYSNTSLDRIPDYRVQLYWQPDITLTSKKTVKYFYASDITGTYEITLEGYTNKGDYKLLKHYFKIR
ncbi:hypothetical protein ATE84_1652 [Aquimarina sp. MAR_2010_214]|uniref:hypothetical protein n=1 Tax=Aquimarina sp. MAR_2010_214 TaxID=1250026 RepID=UPI000CB254B1|nr:hypothetical protein [Aquimarina sp. MAR_2010_214]PKV49618.1 hypothetical protein ATE84_1652 [Aquimarina sp. MAR_2010_214]